MAGASKQPMTELTKEQRKEAKEAEMVRNVVRAADMLESSGTQKTLKIKEMTNKGTGGRGRRKSIGKKKKPSLIDESSEGDETESESPERLVRKTKPGNVEPRVTEVADRLNQTARKASIDPTKDSAPKRPAEQPASGSTVKRTKTSAPATETASQGEPSASATEGASTAEPSATASRPTPYGPHPTPHKNIFQRRAQMAAGVLYSNRGQLPYERLHNQIACLNSKFPLIDRLGTIMDFLARSRVNKAITAEPQIYEKVIESFWNTAYYDSESKQICAKIGSLSVEICEADVRRVLELGDDPNDPLNPLKEKVRVCMLKCGYPDPKRMIKKSLLCPPFKYLAHVLMLCLSNRKFGTDTMNEEITKVFASLIMNMPFNISKMIWTYMVEAASGKTLEFLMYPRFIQMILDDKYTDLPKDGHIIDVYKMGSVTLGHMCGSSDRLKVKPKEADFWGAIVDPEYVCPPDSEFLEAIPIDDLEIEMQQPTASTSSRKKKTAESDRHTDETLQHMDVESTRRHARLVVKSRSGDARGTPAAGTGTSLVDPQAFQELLTRVGKLEKESAADKLEIAVLKRRLTRERRKRKDEQKKNFDYRKKVRNMDRLLTIRKLEIEALADGEDIKDIEAVDPAEHSDPEPDTESETENRGTDPVA